MPSDGRTERSRVPQMLALLLPTLVRRLLELGRKAGGHQAACKGREVQVAGGCGKRTVSEEPLQQHRHVQLD